ncbi:MAG: tRNA (adenosine(37)-N6)-dimethylallyltransferase MiaA [Deltaproteobacteria bacterium]|nr:tRNA (adenosine(37)-N6)-dimethylallyltransferase MiaA [Deltaproteobacteria bacterium]
MSKVISQRPVSVLLVVGPTASGKSSLALSLAQRFDAELVSADSVQIFKQIDIGSAKPTLAERALVAHHVIDCEEPDAFYDAARFVLDADQAISDIVARGRRVIVVGGTGLYQRALVRGLAPGIGRAPDVRERLHARASLGRHELTQMHAELAAVDPEYAAKISTNDPIRIVRALEVFEISGVPMSVHHARHAAMPPRYRALWLGIETDAAALKPRVIERARAMLSAGWIDETRAILQRYGPSIKPLTTVGYAQVLAHILSGSTDSSELLQAIVQSTTAFAKRQRTWFRGEPDVIWDDAMALDSSPWHARIEAFFQGQ